ncbi:MAG: tetratricopeptide repeat protein [Anaerolineae bacterium]|nr:tetratricopeptide repeat protein [Anaerolineae bacterium]
MSDEANKTVFISYRRDVASFIARAVFQDLRANSWDAFIDVESIAAGEFDRIILNQIAARAHFVVILTPGTLERCAQPGDWLRREIEYAFEKNRNIVPLMTNGFDFASNLTHLTGKLTNLQQLNGLPVYHEYFDAAMERLRTRYLKQPVYGAVVPVPASDHAEVERRTAEAVAQPQVTTEQLSAEQYFNRASKKRREEKDLDGAIEDYTQAIRLNPNYAAAYNKRGIARKAKRDIDSAIADYDEAIRLNPTFAAAYNNRGWALALKGKMEIALEDCNEALRLDSTNAHAYDSRGYVLMGMGDLAGAERDFNKAIQLDKNLAGSYYQRGKLRQARSDMQGALADFEQYVALGGSSDFNNLPEVEQMIRELKQKLGQS